MSAEQSPFQDNTQAQAVLYCRVSSKRQVEEGNGLDSQATRCRDYAERKGYEVIKIFEERAVSGGALDRPSFNALLRFIKKQASNGIIVVIDDISRFARDIESHWALRRTLKETGGKLESPSINFGEDSDSILIENLLASVSQHQRQKNAEQTKNRMWARTMNGYWCFPAPPGYRYDKVHGHGKLLVRDEPVASIIAEALEGFASGRFETQAEVKRFLESKPDFINKYDSRQIRYEEISRLMNRPHYAGYIQVPDWGIDLRKGQHEGIITLETFTKVQDRLKKTARVPFRKDINDDFPLRGFVTCGDCDHPMTSCWSKGKAGKKHPYYMCFRKGCVSYRKSIRRDELEGAFAEILSGLTPSETLFTIARKMLKTLWSERVASTSHNKAALAAQIKAADQKIDGLLDKLLEVDSSTVIKACEKKIEKLERDKLVLKEKAANCSGSSGSFEKVFELASRILANPCNLWLSRHIELQRLVLKLVFSDKMAYHRNQGFRTPTLSLPFKALVDFSDAENNMAEEVGFEPTVRFHARRFSRPVHSTTLPLLRSDRPSCPQMILKPQKTPQYLWGMSPI